MPAWFVPSAPDPIEVDQQVSRAAEHLIPSVGWRVGYQSRVFHAAKEHLERRVHLQARKRTPETGVDAATPAEVLVVLALRVELIRVRESLRVPVCGTIKQEERRALWDNQAGDFDIGESASGGEELDRRLKAKHLLDGAGNQLRPASQ